MISLGSPAPSTGGGREGGRDAQSETEGFSGDVTHLLAAMLEEQPELTCDGFCRETDQFVNDPTDLLMKTEMRKTKQFFYFSLSESV